MRLQKLTIILFCLCFISIPFSKADTSITTQTFNLNYQNWNIQDIYHNNTIISFTVTSGVLVGNATLNYDSTNGTMTIIPVSSAVALTVSANSTDFLAYFNGDNLTGGTLALPANSTSTITWQWTPSTVVTVTEEEMAAYIIIAAIVVAGVCFALFMVRRKRQED